PPAARDTETQRQITERRMRIHEGTRRTRRTRRRGVMEAEFQEEVGLIPREEQQVAGEFSPDVMAMLLADKRSENTRRAYRHDLSAFFLAVYGKEPCPELLR